MGKPAVVGEGLEPSSRGLRGECKMEVQTVVARLGRASGRVELASPSGDGMCERATDAGRKTRGRRRGKQRFSGV